MEQKSGDLKLFLATVGDFITEIEKKGSGQQKKKKQKNPKALLYMWSGCGLGDSY